MRRKIVIAQMLLASPNVEIKSVSHVSNTEKGFMYKVLFTNGKTYDVLIKPGSTIAVKIGDDEFETLSIGVPYDIVNILENDEKEFHLSLTGYLKDSDAFKEQVLKF